jgi:hypothetical protein
MEGEPAVITHALVVDDLERSGAVGFKPRPLAAWLHTASGRWVAPLGTAIPMNLPIGACVRRIVVDFSTMELLP